MQRHVISIAIFAALTLSIHPALRAEDAADYIARAKVLLDENPAYSNKEAHDKAIEYCDKALKLDPKSAAAYNERARAWLAKLDYDKALADCDKALSLDPKSAHAYFIRSWAWSYKHEYDKAIADCDKAIAVDPKSSDAYFGRGDARWQKGELDKAAEDFKHSLTIAPDQWNVRDNLGVLLWKQAQLQEQKAANAEAAGNPESAKTCRQKSAALKEEAKAQWIEGIKVRPTAAYIHSNLGYAYSDAAFRSRDAHESSSYLNLAEQHLRQAVRLMPKAPRAHNNLGRVLLRRGEDLQSAARAAEAKGKSDPAEAAKAKQLNSDANAKRDAALEEFRKAIELDPTLLEAHLNLGEVRFQENDLDKAETQYRAILQFQKSVAPNAASDQDMAANFGHAYVGLARIAIARKKTDDAIHDLRMAIELNPKDAVAQKLLTSLRN